MAFIIFICLLSVFYTYFGYPVLLAAFTQLRASRQPVTDDKAGAPPLSVTVIISARNEEEVIEAKLRNTLALRFRERPVAEQLRIENGPVQVIVASDASDDSTDAIVRTYAEYGVELVRLPERAGKESAQRAAIAVARGAIVVFTDAKIRLEEDALDCFAAYFQRADVGAVSSHDRVEATDGEQSGEGFYVRY
ncbi:MAG: glycosyltransferase, partial [Bdellovibrionales bacterium]|nr:glycosyltransferase [Bdellovibrionales bacterium]